MKPVEEFILKCPGSQAEILGFLHQHFEGKGLSSKIAYHIPFYYGNKWVCYLNPLKDQHSVELCFTRAHQFSDPTGLLKSRQRKQIKGLILRSLETIPLQEIDQILELALKLDQN